PRASTVTVTATSTSTYYSTIWFETAVTVYTSTTVDTTTSIEYEEATSTTTVTVSAPVTEAVPTPNGFTPVVSNNPDATLRVTSSAISDLWDVEDEWWTELDDYPIIYYDSARTMTAVPLGAQETAIPAAMDAPLAAPIAAP
ncbi:hypothetical protein, partial [Campylobacter lari]|uniref:hypothetical protein n=1 Tax=Campylobacter lari TaxID=201 RepID=UPI001BDAE697